MKKKTIDIPIYHGTLTMILDEDFSHLEKIYKPILPKEFKSFKPKNAGAVVLKDKTKYRNYVVSFTDPEHLSNIAHEIVHIKNHIFSDCAMNLDRKNDEPEAYLTGWLFDEIYKFLIS